MRSKNLFSRLVSFVLCLAITAALLPALASPAHAADKSLLLPQAQKMALANSSEISKKNNQIVLKQMKYTEAVAGIKAKMKNLRSFRWSPLLSFKFPQKLNMSQDFELNIKPLNLQTEIDILRHEKDDLTFKILAKVDKLYTDLYVTQEKIAFTGERLKAAENELSRNEARLVTGDAVQKDIDKMTATVYALTTELSTEKRTFESDKQKLGELIKLDISSGYRFTNSLKTLSLPREKLAWLTQYTLDHDQNFYATKMAESTALLNLNAYESLMKNQYGDKMSYITSFINAARQGQDVDYAAFQIKYREMLKELDRPWSFSIKILFFRFTMEWFKGAISGTRYIEDEMYAVYTACMEYAGAKRDKESAEKELRASVADGYESLVTGYNGYLALKKTMETSKANYEKVSALNKLGKADFSELKDARDSYEEMQLEMVDSLAAYTVMLYDFDRLTCGAVTAFMKGAGDDLKTGKGGDSFKILDPITDPYYYIYNSVEDITFHIGISIPNGFEPSITAFEVWIDGKQIGARTQAREELTHLALDYADGAMMTIRLYDSDKFVAECEIDPSVPRDILPLEPAEEPTIPKETKIGSYEATTTPVGELSTTTITLKLDPGNVATSYFITFSDKGNVLDDKLIPVDESFTYLSLLGQSLDEVQLMLYDKQGALSAKARFNTETLEIFAETAKP
ncbi:MAG: TolC family protein [Oscillospiraceae bacterium]